MSKLIYVEKVDLAPGYKTKHLVTVNPEEDEYQAIMDKVKIEVAGMEQLQGLGEDEYYIRIKPIEVEVLVK